ncbi:hypothetical protein [Bradyrhizobium barranii]|uniref:hypothetical protein n=1 Tax=Bradyrhizobium barranii TaxID=2992140 RepID=UPI002AB1371F|nr:hypothetical protein [Bradyrhizobium barranii]
MARRHGCRPQQVHDWRRRGRLGQLVLPAAAGALSFAPLVSQSSPPGAGYRVAGARAAPASPRMSAA